MGTPLQRLSGHIIKSLSYMKMRWNKKVLINLIESIFNCMRAALRVRLLILLYWPMKPEVVGMAV